MKALYSIVGTKFRDGAAEHLKTLKRGAPLRLVREPDNIYDKKAVAIYSGETCIGYLPAKQNGGIALAMDSNPSFRDSLGSSNSARLVFSPNSGFPQVEVDE